MRKKNSCSQKKTRTVFFWGLGETGGEMKWKKDVVCRRLNVRSHLGLLWPQEAFDEKEKNEKRANQQSNHSIFWARKSIQIYSHCRVDRKYRGSIENITRQLISWINLRRAYFVRKTWGSEWRIQLRSKGKKKYADNKKDHNCILKLFVAVRFCFQWILPTLVRRQATASRDKILSRFFPETFWSRRSEIRFACWPSGLVLVIIFACFPFPAVQIRRKP